jgi:hypothetical protein
VSLQGGTEFVGRLFGEKGGTPITNPAGIGYFGAIVGGGLFFVASIPFLLHVRRHGERWHSRVPVVWLEGLDTAAWQAKAFQLCILLLLVFAPAVGVPSERRHLTIGQLRAAASAPRAENPKEELGVAFNGTWKRISATRDRPP